MNSDHDFNEKYSRLIKSLLSKTRSGKIDWSMNHFSGEVECELGNAVIALHISNDDDGGEHLSMRVKDNFGATVDTIRPMDFVSMPDSSNVRDMYELYRIARRSATNAGFILDKILNEIDDETD